MPAIVITPQGNDANADMALAVAEQLGIAGEASNVQINQYWRDRAVEFIHGYRDRKAKALASAGVALPNVT